MNLKSWICNLPGVGHDWREFKAIYGPERKICKRCKTVEPVGDEIVHCSYCDTKFNKDSVVEEDCLSPDGSKKTIKWCPFCHSEMGDTDD